MDDQYYGFELEDIMKQFVTAFNSIVINRFDKNKLIQNTLQANFIYGPKERVMYDIVNRNQHIKLPVVAVHLNSLQIDKSRLQNKIPGYYISNALSAQDGAYNSDFMYKPTPVNIGVGMSILTRFNEDMNQIISNFVPYTDPYIVISWKVPSNQNMSDDMEIRSKVSWSGNFNMNNPINVSEKVPYRYETTTDFTIEGWLFRNNPSNRVANIFTIDENFVPVSGFEYM